MIAYLAGAAALVVVVVRVLRRRTGRFGARRSTWSAFLLFPLIMATIPFVKTQGNLRYLFFLAPVPLPPDRPPRRVPTGRGRRAGGRRPRDRRRASLGSRSSPRQAGAPHLVGVVDSLDEVVRVLDREGIEAVHADYWIAYRLAFETDERIVGSPSAGSLRYPPYDDRVRDADRAAWIVSTGSGQEAGACARRSTSSGVGYRVIPAGESVGRAHRPQRPARGAAQRGPRPGRLGDAPAPRRELLSSI